MKKWMLALLLLLLTSPSWALHKKDLHLLGGIGIFGSRGLLGVSADKFFSPRHALSLSAGVDIIGSVSFFGYKYFGSAVNTSNQFFDKCLFLFECDSHYYTGFGIQYAGSTTSLIIENGEERKYTDSPKWLGLISVGTRNIFPNHILLDVEVSYRHLLAGGRSSQLAGKVADDKELLEFGYRTLCLNMALGYSF